MDRKNTVSVKKLGRVTGGANKPAPGTDTVWALECSCCHAVIDKWYGPTPEGGDIIFRDCPECREKGCVWWVYRRE